MGKSLIITEKPSVAREFARILGVSGRNDGYIEDSHYAITWCVGHLVEMVYPEEYDIKYKKWKLEDLPFLPKDYKYNVIPSVSKQYDIVHKLLHREDIDTVYWAGDAGKEGQTIEENIRRFGGVREGMKELRVWIDSQTEEEIKRGIAEARPMSDYDNLANSGIMRTIEDYAMGINFSRVMSVKYGNLLNDAAGTKSYTAIAVGRVMTCVLGMVVIREREIRNFVETPFYRVVGNFFDAEIEGEWKAVEGSSYYASPLLYKENGFKEKVHAEKLIKDLKELNKEAEIDYDGYNIESLVSADKLVLPEGYEYDESLGINNKNSTENQNYISIKVNVKANNKGGNYMNNNKDKKDNKTKGKIKPIFRKFKSFFIKEKTDKKERKPKFRKFKKFMLAAGTKISRMPIYIRNKFVSIKDYLEEEISININKDNNTFEPSDIDIDEDVDDNNKNNEKDIEDNQKNTNTNDINEINTDENHNDDTKKIEIEENNNDDTKKIEIEENNDDVNDNNDEIKLTAGENLKRIAKIRSEIERLQRNKEELKNIENASKFAKEETAKHYDDETKKLKNQIKEIVDNNKYTNEAGREISMEERDRFDRLDAVQADIIETIKKQKQINSEFNEAWYGHMGEKVSEELLKTRATLKNELDAINIKLSLLKQKRDEIVAEKPIKWYKAM